MLPMILGTVVLFQVPFYREYLILCLTYSLTYLSFCSMVGTNLSDTNNLPSASSTASKLAVEFFDSKPTIFCHCSHSNQEPFSPVSLSAK